MSNRYELIAKTGVLITSLGSLTSFGDSPSINDLGNIAFVGQSNSASDLLVANDLGNITNLSVAYPNSFSKAIQINNQNKVVARDSLSGGSAIRVWNFNAPGSFQVYATGAFPSSGYNFENILPFPSLNNNGQAVFLADPIGSANFGIATLRGTNAFGSRTYNQIVPTTSLVRPMIADNGNIVVRDPASTLLQENLY